MLKHSRQRDSIKQYLATHHTHPTAETVYLEIKKEYPNISLGTVYRNLNLLADMGEILRIPSGSGPDRYDGNTSPHYHFVCERCGRVLDMDMERQSGLDEAAGEHFEGSISGHEMYFYGLCPECNPIKK